MTTQPEAGTPEFWARVHPGAPAVIDGATVMTHAEWNDLADRVAEGLAGAGLGPGDRMGTRPYDGEQIAVIDEEWNRLPESIREAADIIFWLSSPLSYYVTGQTVPVTGGARAGMS